MIQNLFNWNIKSVALDCANHVNENNEDHILYIWRFSKIWCIPTACLKQSEKPKTSVDANFIGTDNVD